MYLIQNIFFVFEIRIKIRIEIRIKILVSKILPSTANNKIKYKRFALKQTQRRVY